LSTLAIVLPMPNLLTQFLKRPRQIGSVAASSRWLSETMAQQSDTTGRVLELGAGTGPITELLLQKSRNLEAVELDSALATHLRGRFPGLIVHERDVEDVLREAKGPYRSIISGIPFAVMSKDKRDRVFRLIRERLEPGGRFVMFQYSKTTERELRELFGDANVTAIFVPWNIPPAFVFTCVKQ